jgi:cell division protein FtsZ
MTLGEQSLPKPEATIPEAKVEDLLAPKLVDEEYAELPLPVVEDLRVDNRISTVNFVGETEEEETAPVQLHLKIKEEPKQEKNPEELEFERKKQWLDDRFERLRQSILTGDSKPAQTSQQNTSQAPAASGGYLARPSNIYADSKPEVSTSKPVEEPVPAPVAKVEDPETFDMQLVDTKRHSASGG